MLFSALQTKGIIAINCKLEDESIWIDLLIVNDPILTNTIQTLIPSFQDERFKGAVKVKIPPVAGLYRDEILAVCP